MGGGGQAYGLHRDMLRLKGNVVGFDACGRVWIHVGVLLPECCRHLPQVELFGRVSCLWFRLGTYGRGIGMW